MGTIFYVFGEVCYAYTMLFNPACLNSVCVCVLAHVQHKTSEIRVLELEENLNIP